MKFLFKKYIFYFSIFSIFLFPYFVFAQTNPGSCSRFGYSIYTINGINTDLTGVRDNRRALEDKLLIKTYKNEPLTVDYLYNPTHGSITDTAYAVGQKYLEQIMFDIQDADFAKILSDASIKVKTQKLLLVGHSQGNFYANIFYDTVADKQGGVPSQSIGVYGVANPANHVAGGGLYLTSDTDKVIADIVSNAPGTNTLKSNAHIDYKLSDGDLLGHDFSKIYLNYESDRIVSDIKTSLDKLKNNNIQNEQAPCINPPQLNLVQKIEGTFLASVDFVIDAKNQANKVNSYITNGPYNIATAIVGGIRNATIAFGNVLSNLSANVIGTLSNTNSLATITPAVLNTEATPPPVVPDAQKKTPTPVAVVTKPVIVATLCPNGNILENNCGADPSIENVPITLASAPVVPHIIFSGRREDRIPPVPDVIDETPPIVPPTVSVPTNITDNITADTIWNLAGSPYLVQNTIEIESGVTLTIDPGVVIKIDGGFLDVVGSIDANGTADLPIIFTSSKDDSADGDTNEDGNISVPSSGDWGEIWIESSAMQSTLNHVTLHYSSGGLFLYYNSGSLNSDTFYSDQGIEVMGSHGSFVNLTIPNIEIHEDSTVSIDTATISNPENYFDSAVGVWGGSSITLKNATVSGGDTWSLVSVYQNSSAEFDSVNITGNGFGWGLSVFDASTLKANAVTIDNTGGDALIVFNQSTATFDNGSVTNSKSDYEASTEVYNGSSLSATRSTFDGGTADGIDIYNDASLTLSHCTIKNFAGSGVADFGDNIDGNFNPDIVSIINSIITGNNIGVDIYNSSNAIPSQVSISNNSIYDNVFLGAQTYSTSTILSLANNFWGDKTGPTNVTLNPDGLGNAVSDFVNFVPWCADETCELFVSPPPLPDPNLATQLKIITAPQTIGVDIASNIITVQSQNSLGELTKVSSTTHVNLTSNSGTGLFASASASTNLCDTNWTKTSVTIATNKANKSFCYKDSAVGTPTITVSATGLTSGSQIFTVN